MQFPASSEMNTLSRFISIGQTDLQVSHIVKVGDTGTYSYQAVYQTFRRVPVKPGLLEDSLLLLLCGKVVESV